MKIVAISVCFIAAIFLLVSLGFAGSMMEGNAEKGKALFNDPKAFGGVKSCSSCHPDGKGLEKAGVMGKKEWDTPAGKYKSLEEAINACITMANKGKAIDTKSQEMKDMVAYIKSLGKEMKHEMPMKEKGKGY
jgi:cytochrome c